MKTRFIKVDPERMITLRLMLKREARRKKRAAEEAERPTHGTAEILPFPSSRIKRER